MGRYSIHSGVNHYMTKEDVAFMAHAIAVANKHTDPDAYVTLVLAEAFPDETPIVEIFPIFPTA